MKYNIDTEDTFKDTLIFWINLFFRDRSNNFSPHRVKKEDKSKLEELKIGFGRKYSNIDEIINACKGIRSLGVNGLQVYASPIKKLYDNLLNYGPASMKEIDQEHIKEFLSSTTQYLSPATRKSYKIAISAFFSFIDSKCLDYEFKIDLKKSGGSSRSSKLPAYMNDEEIDRFLDTLNNFPFSKKTAARNKAIIKLILFTGLRTDEALSLKKNELIKPYHKSDYYEVHVIGKGDKYRKLLLKSLFIDKELQEWLNYRTCKTDLVFCNQKGGKLSQAYLYRIVNKILNNANIYKEKNSIHLMRHTRLSSVYKHTKDLVLVQELAGHSDINTSKIYTHLDRDRIKHAADIGMGTK